MSLNNQKARSLYIQGDRCFQKGDYTKAIAIFEKLSKEMEQSDRNYFHIQRNLVKAYYKNENTEKAIALCELIIQSNIIESSIWAEKFLATIKGEPIVDIVNLLTEEEKKYPETKQRSILPIRQKTLSEFKNYCQNNLLEKLKHFERKRKSALLSIFLSGIGCILLSGGIALCLTNLLNITGAFNFYFLNSFILLFFVWINYCRACILVYGLGFKREIIENIVNFIDDNNTLNYANRMLLEDLHQTSINFGKSLLFKNNPREPDFLEQEDCVFGSIGDVDIFFSEISAYTTSKSDRAISQFTSFKKSLDSDNTLIRYLFEIVYSLFYLVRQIFLSIAIFYKILITSDRETQTISQIADNKISNHNKFKKHTLFRGLFFTAKFPKNFKKSTFVLPNNLKNKLTPQGWRGQIINLEDSEFNSLFITYSKSQLESRYILCTSLMERLIKFRNKARRNIYLSFIEGTVYVAIPYRYNLFEPKIFKSMLSFAPLKEYFENMQLTIAIVRDLNLDRDIWN